MAHARGGEAAASAALPLCYDSVRSYLFPAPRGRGPQQGWLRAAVLLAGCWMAHARGGEAAASAALGEGTRGALGDRHWGTERRQRLDRC